MKDRHKGFHILTGGLAILCLLLTGYLFWCERTEIDRNGKDTDDVSKTVQETLQSLDKSGDKQEEITVKRIALTFDDGPHPVYTPMLLEGLKERGVKATFFLMGTAVEAYPEIAKQISDQGHMIGNHTYHHVSLEDADADMIQEEVTLANELIEQVTGQYPQFLRPPFGSSGSGIENETGMICVMWDIDPLDWCTSDASVVVDRVITHAKDECIILMHDQYKSSVMAAFTIIDELQKQGYEFVTVDELIWD